VRSDVPQKRRGLSQRLMEIWERYRIPVAVTELHNGCSRDEHLRWLIDGWKDAQVARAAGADVRAVTSWSLFGAQDWNSLMTRRDGYYECGAFDTQGPLPRPTIVAQAIADLARHGRFDHPVLDGAGWWHADAGILQTARPLVLMGRSDVTDDLEACCAGRRLRTLRAGKHEEAEALFLHARAWAIVSVEPDRDSRHHVSITCLFPDGTRLRLKQPSSAIDAHAVLDRIIDGSVDHLLLAEPKDRSLVIAGELRESDAF
jgi:dTDP-4-dehydrorhamnose reductase